MDPQIDRLLRAFHQGSKPPPADLADFLRRLPGPGALPSPWDTWVLVGLVRHRERQLWVADIIRSRLRGSPADLAAMGSFGHPEGVPQSGTVPGLPEWEYYFHGRGCCLTHKVNGDAIDVDFFGDTAEYFDAYFYIWYLESLRQREPPEQRIRQLYRSLRPVTIAMTDLIASGALTALRGEKGPPRIADEVLEHAEAIEAFCAAWANPEDRLWLSALVGDWPGALEAAAGSPELEQIAFARAAECRTLRRKRLLQVTGFSVADALHALAEFGGADAELEEALRGPPSGVTSSALEIVGQLDDPRWCPPIYELHTRVRPGGEIPEPHLWMESLKFLLRHGHRAGELLAALPGAGGPEIGEALLLALQHAPEHALPLVRKGLIADIPANRSAVAAILALIGKPWSTRELLRALEVSDEQEKTADARAALLELGDPAAEEAVLAWEEKNPHENEVGTYLELDGRRVGPFYTIGEISLQNRASWIRYEMKKLHDRVRKVRGVVPPEPAPG